MPIKAETLDVEAFLTPDNLACQIARQFQEWDQFRSGWRDEKSELRNFLYATDTSTTSLASLPWMNRTTLPKLTQIYDNLKANYVNALFPRDKWLMFEPGDETELSKEKAETVEKYILTKLKEDNFRTTANTLVDDYLIYGNAFATVEWVEDYFKYDEGKDTEEIVKRFVGPRIVRISPLDIVFNPTAARWEDTPKIIRSLVSIGTLEKLDIRDDIMGKVHSNRRMVGSSTSVDKSEAYVADGFSSIEHYYSSGFVELLTFYGDIYDKYTNEFKAKRKIVVVDRAYIAYDEQFSSWLGEDAVFHAGWRTRPDNLWAMGPLDNLVGIQYRADHLENLKADVFDQVAVPSLKIKGHVDDFDQGPGARIILGEEGDVEYLAPEVSALNANNEIPLLFNIMEEFAGAPRQAMGIRTPGEKTATEFQGLSDGASRIFQHKTAQLEIELFEKIFNAQLEAAVRNMNSSDTIKVFDDEAQMEIFKTIKRSDIVSKGKLRPVGARHFADKLRRIADLNNLIGIKNADPTIGVHLSGKMLAKKITDEMEVPDLYEEMVGISEQAEIQEAALDQEADTLEGLQEKQDIGV
jgi:hypothetical protein